MEQRPTRNRECGACTECCNGTLVGDIFGRTLDKGRPCHYLGGEGCTIYSQRPSLCRAYRCEWLRDDASHIPEWMRPDLSGVIITVRRWGENGELLFWTVAESRGKIDSTVLNWVYMHVSQHNICANIEVDGRWYQIGPPEFVDFIRQGKSFD